MPCPSNSLRGMMPLLPSVKIGVRFLERQSPDAVSYASAVSEEAFAVTSTAPPSFSTASRAALDAPATLKLSFVFNSTEERRGGKESVSTGRSRGSQYH